MWADSYQRCSVTEPLFAVYRLAELQVEPLSRSLLPIVIEPETAASAHVPAERERPQPQGEEKL